MTYRLIPQIQSLQPLLQLSELNSAGLIQAHLRVTYAVLPLQFPFPEMHRSHIILRYPCADFQLGRDPAMPSASSGVPTGSTWYPTILDTNLNPTEAEMLAAYSAQHQTFWLWYNQMSI